MSNKLAKLAGVTEAPKKDDEAAIAREDSTNADTTRISDNAYAVVDTDRRTFPNPLSTGFIIGKALLAGRKEVDPTQYETDLKSQLLGTSLSATRLALTTRDQVNIPALELKHKPPSERTIVIFQGQRGNFQSNEQLTRIREIAEKTGANVIAFNYRKNPTSGTSLINDATVVTDYLFDRTVHGASTPTPDKVTLYGDSLGGAVAALTAAKLKKDNGLEVKGCFVRAPKSLASAAKFFNLSILSENPFIKRLATLVNDIKGQVNQQKYESLLSKKNWSLDAQAAVNELNPENYTIIHADRDQTVPAAMALTGKNLKMCSTPPDVDAHTVSLGQLKDKDGKNNALDHLNTVSNKTTEVQTKPTPPPTHSRG